jgi:hypothetical protein
VGADHRRSYVFHYLGWAHRLRQRRPPLSRRCASMGFGRPGLAGRAALDALKHSAAAVAASRACRAPRASGRARKIKIQQNLCRREEIDEGLFRRKPDSDLIYESLIAIAHFLNPLRARASRPGVGRKEKPHLRGFKLGSLR